MRIVIAPDKFKGSLTADQAGRAMAEGALLAEPEAQIILCPMADGGEGTVEAVATATGAQKREAVVAGPLPGQTVTAQWGFLPRGIPARAPGPGDIDALLVGGTATAVVEMAQASGLWLVPEESRNPMLTSTVGTGQLIKAAMDAGCRQIIVGIGGSATVDGGMGMAHALGYRFLDSGGKELQPGGAALEHIVSIDSSTREPNLDKSSFLVASDVDNPLTGKQGAARVFGPQKGATPEQVESLERGLGRLAEELMRTLHADVISLPGAGAAGGLGAGLAAFCGARITSGVELLAELAGLSEKVEGADLVLTGEGSFDSQTFRGKTPAGVADIARRRGVPAVVLAGRIQAGAEHSLGEGVAEYCISPGPMELAEAMERAAELLTAGTERLLRLLQLMRLP
jgi:glycerate 2-kinase